MWAAAIAARAAHPNVPITFVINPNNGPGSSKQASYVAGIAALKAAGITVLGYDDLGQNTPRGVAAVKADVDAYHIWYPNIDGIFFDDMNNGWSYPPATYSSLDAYVKSLGMTFTMGNPGTGIPLTYVGTFDSLVVYESGGYPPITSLTPYPVASAFIALGVAYNASFITKASPFVSWLYPTDQSGGNPYTILPSYFNTLVASLDTGVVPPPPLTSTISVAAQDTSGLPLLGLSTLIDDGGVQLDHRFTPAVFTAPQGQTYDIIIQDSAAYQFDHWLDGSLLPDEKVVLGTTNVSLTAVMAPRAVPPPPSNSILQVNTADMTGNPLTGIYVSVKAQAKASFSPLAYAPKVTIIASNYQNFIFNHWEDGTTNATRVLKLAKPTLITAYYAT